MRIPRSRGAVSGLLLMILGAWGALVPFIGPYFDLVIGPDETWNWSTDRLWLSVLPGVVAFIGGFILLRSAHRGGAGLGAWMGIAAGAWFVVGPTVSRLWTSDGTSALGQPAGGTNRQVLEVLTMYQGLGVLIAVVGAFALGRLAVRSVRDVELAEAAALETSRADETVVVPRERERDLDRDGVADDRFRREPEPVTTREPVGATAAPAAPTTPEPATSSSDTTRVIPPATTAPAPAPTAETTTTRRGGLLGRVRRD